MKLLLSLLFVIQLFPIQSQTLDICSSIGSNASLGLYQRYSGQPSNVTESHYLFVKNQTEWTPMWELIIEWDSYRNQMAIKLGKQSNLMTPPRTWQMFGLISDGNIWNCTIKDEVTLNSNIVFI